MNKNRSMNAKIKLNPRSKKLNNQCLQLNFNINMFYAFHHVMFVDM